MQEERKSRLNFLPPPSSLSRLSLLFSFQGKWNLMHFSQQQQPQLFDVFSRKERLSHIHAEENFLGTHYYISTNTIDPLKMYQFWWILRHNKSGVKTRVLDRRSSADYFLGLKSALLLPFSTLVKTIQVFFKNKFEFPCQNYCNDFWFWGFFAENSPLWSYIIMYLLFTLAST